MSKSEYKTLVEIAKDAQDQHGCPNTTSLRRHCKAYAWWPDCEAALTIREQDAAISEGFCLSDH